MQRDMEVFLPPLTFLCEAIGLCITYADYTLCKLISPKWNRRKGQYNEGVEVFIQPQALLWDAIGSCVTRSNKQISKLALV